MTVIRQNHIGDSPATIGKILAGAVASGHGTDPKTWPSDWQDRMEAWYRVGHDDPLADEIALDLQEKKRASEYYIPWAVITSASILRNQAIYDMLGVNLPASCIRGESFYYGM